MTQHEAVIEAMRQNGGYATLGELNHIVPVAAWGTKTPFATIRRIVQQKKEYFFKIRPGLWALKEARHALPASVLALQETAAPTHKAQEYTHYYYQGLLVEAGNYEGFQTYVPPQDKNQMFLGKRLGDIVTMPTLPAFTYERVLARVRTIDVIWFNKRGFPHACYEVEHATSFANSLDKYVDLQDFIVDLRVVADGVKNRDYQSKISRTSVADIKERVRFLSYEEAAELHSKLGAAHAIKQSLGL